MNSRYESSQHSNIKLRNLGVLGLGMSNGHWAVLMICDYGSQGSRIKSDVAIGQKYTQHIWYPKRFFFPPMHIKKHIYAPIPVPCWGGYSHPCIVCRYFDPSQKIVKDWQRLGVVHHESRRLRSVATGSPWSQELATWNWKVRQGKVLSSGCSLVIWNLNLLVGA